MLNSGDSKLLDPTLTETLKKVGDMAAEVLIVKFPSGSILTTLEVSLSV
jgi:hypothetical protein